MGNSDRLNTHAKPNPLPGNEQGERTPMPGKAEQAKPPNGAQEETCPRVKVCHTPPDAFKKFYLHKNVLNNVPRKSFLRKVLKESFEREF